jgi:hypothetical protein
MWIPESDRAVEGKIIHAIGSPFQGYKLEIKSYKYFEDRKEVSSDIFGVYP